MFVAIGITESSKPPYGFYAENTNLAKIVKAKNTVTTQNTLMWFLNE